MHHPDQKHQLLRLIAVLTLIVFSITSASASVDREQHERLIIGFQGGSVQALDTPDLSVSDFEVLTELTELNAVVVSVSDPDRFVEEVL